MFVTFIIIFFPWFMNFVQICANLCIYCMILMITFLWNFFPNVLVVFSYFLVVFSYFLVVFKKFSVVFSAFKWLSNEFKYFPIFSFTFLLILPTVFRYFSYFQPLPTILSFEWKLVLYTVIPTLLHVFFFVFCSFIVCGTSSVYEPAIFKRNLI